MSKFLRNINYKYFARSKKNSTFANDDEPTALATDIGKPTPILSGKDAERFIKNMEEAEAKAKAMASAPKSKEEIEKELSYKRIIYKLNKSELEDLEKEIKKLEVKLESLNGKTEEE